MELGPVGDLLASSDFSVTATVLVVQQHMNQASKTEMGLASQKRDQLGHRLRI